MSLQIVICNEFQLCRGRVKNVLTLWFLVSGNCRCSDVSGRLISSRGDVPWPARSQDLAPCDFFLWEQLKAEVFKHRLRTLPDLRHAIQEEIGLIPHEMLVKVIQNFRSRIQQCIDRKDTT
ncbi:hypothetical protein ANN_18277 [Periplaneta americana]|uniref:Uncharacterized protein n=1 Tax=Periplaneta americana TaxID=6978 RepID=A0ABQ8SPG9_PERAM|nr:hypothetical protein ANN_18277 [Periplaneta americana]